MTGLVGKLFVVTGVASGIGLATAIFLEKSGAQVIGIDRNALSKGVNLKVFRQVDISDPASIERGLESLEGPIDGIANVAGVSSAAPYETQFRVNYLGPRHLTQCLMPLLSQDASIVSVASGTAVNWRQRIGLFKELAAASSFSEGLDWLQANPQTGIHSYGRTKEALVVWTQIMAVKAVGTGRRFNTVSPGPVATPMLGEFKQSIGQSIIDADIARASRAGDAVDIAAAIGYLLTAESSWINGADIPVDGGWAASALLDSAKWPPDTSQGPAD